MPHLAITDLAVRTDGKDILHGVTLRVAPGDVVALMGPNGSGKSTLAHVIMGHPDFEVVGGTIHWGKQDLLSLKPEERAQAGIFLAFQYPQTVAGVTIGNFLRLAYNAVHTQPLAVHEFLALLTRQLNALDLPQAFMNRYVNDGLSGGEKKRAEMLQLAVLKPRLAILDETDSGLDVDALKVVGQALTTIRQEQPAMSLLVITHHQRILEYVPPDRVAVLRAGKVVREGGAEVLQVIEQQGFRTLR